MTGGAGKGLGGRAARMNAEKQLEIAQLLCVGLLGYAWALIGGAITKIELSGARTYFADRALEPDHVTLSLIGIFKQVEGEHHHFIPVATVIGSGSGLRIRKWVDRLLNEREAVGLISGFVFLKKDVSSARAVDFEKTLLDRLEWIQQNTVGIILLTIDLWA
jgi:hypothetical protein